MLPLRVVTESEAAAGPGARARVALVNMPFAMCDRPSIQCGLLKGAALRAGHEVKVYYLNLEFAAKLGAKLYAELSRLRNDQLLGEWLFSTAAFGPRDEAAAYREACPGVEKTCAKLGVSFDKLCELRQDVFPAWIEHWADKVDWGSYQVAGFSSTFEQNTAALALARAVKKRHSQVVTIFGGANFDGPMGREFVRTLPWIDYAVVGEGDLVFPAMLAEIAAGKSPLGLRGVVGRANGGVVDGGPAASVHDLDSLPDPDYDEFFETLSRLGSEHVFPPDKQPSLLFESARGCWWGEKQHCTFCGLNNNGMAFRSKSPAAARAQLRRLAARYQIIRFEAVDNIMDHRYLQQLCLPLAEDRADYSLFYEVKANLKPEQLKTMVRAGVREIQPGIESLSSHVLSLMRKGVTMLQNVRLLKWSYYYGMRANWNILMGFPGETLEDYQQQIRLMPLLKHLPPPDGVGRIWLERFSPYFFDPAFPVRNVQPLPAYRFLYPADIDLKEIAYFFTYEMDGTVPEEQLAELPELVRQWRAAWTRGPRPEMRYRRAPDWIQIEDRREREPVTHTLLGWESSAYELCGEQALTPADVQGRLASAADAGGLSTEEVRRALDRFCAGGLMVTEGNRYLSLALPEYRYW